jgi:hypothetical protein
LPNEMDWALAKLVRISYVVNQLAIANYPFLLDALVNVVSPFFDGLTMQQCVDPELLEKTRREDYMDTVPCEFNTREQMQTRRRIVSTLTILRNVALGTEHNAKYLSNSLNVLRIVVRGLALSSLGPFLDILVLCMDIFETLAQHIEIGTTENPIPPRLRTLLLESDRSLVLGSLNCLIHLFSKESNEGPLSVPGLLLDQKIVGRLFDLILVQNDAELQNAALQVIMYMSYLGPSICATICQFAPVGSIGHLVSLFCQFHQDPLAPMYKFELPKEFVDRLAKSKPVDSTPIVWGLLENRAREWFVH